MTGRRFRLVLAPQALVRLGCSHIRTREPQVCRGCAVSDLVDLAVMSGQMSVRIQDEWDGSRVFAGETSGIDGRIALAELMALVQEHRSPQRLDGWQTALVQLAREESSGQVA